jgi:hypothetical protein
MKNSKLRNENFACVSLKAVSIFLLNFMNLNQYFHREENVCYTKMESAVLPLVAEGLPLMVE